MFRPLEIVLALTRLGALAATERWRGTPLDRSILPSSTAATLENLGPTFTKLGQALSLRRDLLPERFTAALAALQDRVRPFGDARA